MPRGPCMCGDINCPQCGPPQGGPERDSEQIAMPESFKQWLLSLNEEQAVEFWAYFDGTPDGVLYDDIGDKLEQHIGPKMPFI